MSATGGVGGHMSGRKMVRAIGDVMRERDHQDAKWGEQQHDPVYWVGILAEELGEVAKEAIEIVPMSARGIRPRDESLARLRAELVQLAAVAVAAIEYLDRLPPQEDWTEVGEA